MTKWINMSGKREYEDIIFKSRTICGYHREFKINEDRTRLRGKCSLTDKVCEYELPQDTADCPVYQERFK